MARDFGVPHGDPRSVVLLLDAEVLRAMPAMAQMPSFAGLRGWEPLWAPELRVAWVIFAGPSLVHTERAGVLMRCQGADGDVDAWLDRAAAQHSGGPAALPVPGVHAVALSLDGAPRVAMRAKAHVVAIVPPDEALAVARSLATTAIPEHVSSGEALRVRLAQPHHVLPTLVADHATELRVWLEPTPDAGAELVLEQDLPSPAEAAVAQRELSAAIASHNSIMVKVLLAGLIDVVAVTVAGPVVRARVHATPDQVSALVNLLKMVTPP